MIRLDRYLAQSGLYSRSEASKAIRRGAVTVDGAVIRDPSSKVDEGAVSVTADGKKIPWARVVWVMLNKPAGTVSTTDPDPRSVLALLPPEYRRMGLFPCGRLDVDTTGLLLLTNDGEAAHRLLSPKKHCEKTYRFTCLPITEEQRERLEAGVELGDFETQPASVRLDAPEDREHGEITVTEGKFHQIKRMFQAVGSEILTLERVRFAGLNLDPALRRGEWRLLNDEEAAGLGSE